MGTEVVEDVLVMINAAGQVEKEVEEYSAGRMQVAAQQPPLALVPSAPGPPSSKRFRRICVFCGSSSGRRDCYQDAAIQLGKELVSRKVDLVYGGGSAGLMGHVAQAVHAGGGHVLGIIPRTLMKKELTGETVGEVRAVSNMHQRKAEMVRQSDAFIALPGGYGTMEELLEVITWAQLGIHAKPVGLLNVDGYYDFLITFIEQAVDNGFIKPSQRRIFVSASNAKDLVQKLEEYEPVQDDLVAKLRWEKENVAYGNTNTAITATTTATTSNNNNKKTPPPLQAELAR